MSRKTKNTWMTLLFIATANFCLTGALTVRAQDENAPRRLWDGALHKRRGEAKTSAPARKTTGSRGAAPKKPAAPNQASQSSPPNNAGAQNPPAEQADGEMIGLTIWRLRPSRPADTRDARLLI